MRKLVVSGIVVAGIFIGCSDKEVKDPYLKSLVGQQYNYQVNQKLGGEVETIKADAKKWIAYFPKKDVTIVERKSDRVIIKVIKGKGE